MATETAQRAFHSIVAFPNGDGRRGFGVQREIRYESVGLSITFFRHGITGIDVVLPSADFCWSDEKSRWNEEA
jgi:hypothetical protein